MMIMIVVGNDDAASETYYDIDSDSDNDSFNDNDSDSSGDIVLGFFLSQLFILRYLPWQLRKEKVDLENALEQEQESLVNRLWKKMEKLEKEKRYFKAIIFFLYSIVFHSIVVYKSTSLQSTILSCNKLPF